jgi:hypothetical protein
MHYAHPSLLDTMTVRDTTTVAAATSKRRAPARLNMQSARKGTAGTNAQTRTGLSAWSVADALVEV